LSHPYPINVKVVASEMCYLLSTRLIHIHPVQHG